MRDKDQIFVSEQDVQRIATGPGLVFTALLPDIDHFSGWGGSGVHPLWRDPARQQANFATGLVGYMRKRLGIKPSAQDLLGLDNLNITSWNRSLTDELMALLSVLTGCASIENSQTPCS